MIIQCTISEVRPLHSQGSSSVFQVELLQKELFLELTHLKRRTSEYQSPIRKSSSCHRWRVNRWASWVRYLIVSLYYVSLMEKFVSVLQKYDNLLD